MEIALSRDRSSPGASRPSRFDAVRYKVRGGEIPSAACRSLERLTSFLSVSSEAGSEVTRPFVAGDLCCVSVFDD